LIGTLHAPDETKIIQQGDSKKAPYLTENDPKRSAVRSEIRDSTSGGKDIESKTVSKEKITPVKPFSGSQEYSIIYPQIKRKALIDRISSLWEGFRNRSE